MHILIIGNGIAGATLARRLKERGRGEELMVTLISDEAPYHFSRPAMMYLSTGQLRMEHLKSFPDESWDALGISRVTGHVERIDAEAKQVHLSNGTVLGADVIVLATGSRPNVPTGLNTSLHGVHTYTQMQDVAALDDSLKGAHHGVVIGGGLIGVEAAEIMATHMHARQGSSITSVVREHGFYGNMLPRFESQLVTRHLQQHGIGVRVTTTVSSIEDHDGDGRVDHVTLSDGTVIPADVVVVATGVVPRTQLAKDAGVTVDDGIVVDEWFRTSNATSFPRMRKSIIYAIGDCAQLPWGVQQTWYAGRMHGEHLAEILLGSDEPFCEPIEYNSAKFFDLEWSTYGRVPAESDSASSVLLTDTNDSRCLRIVHDAKRCVVGIHALGLRLRQSTCEQWIAQCKPLDHALEELRDVMFNAEFVPAFVGVAK
ncbi:MAG: NAD(P)/FAD-dependent oxidoreductase [Candidatus Kapabacteria bacterium]|nr:NAD(P)/FAD-dependent oxidoreductase [Candidatus Kapabacteria bacterium]